MTLSSPINYLPDSECREFRITQVLNIGIDGNELVVPEIDFLGSGVIRTNPTPGSTLILQARNTQTGQWIDLITLTSGNNPSILSGQGSITIDGFLDMVGIANPAAPSAGTARFHAATMNGFTRFEQDNESATNLVLGRDNVIIARNNSGANMAKGVAVYISGSTGNVPNIALARANSVSTLPAIGLTLDAINNNSFGQVMKLGIIDSINTSSFSSGNRLFVSATTAGALTNTRPTLPNFVQRIGSVLVSGVGNGSIHVSIAPFIGSEETGTNSASFMVPTIVGGSSTTSDLFLKTTTGVGATGADIHFLVGNNGSIEPMTITNNGSISIATASGQIGFFGNAVVPRPIPPYVQTFSSSSKVHSDFTSANLSIVPATQINPWGFTTQAQADDIATQFAKLRDDVKNIKEVVNALLDDLQLLGLLQ